MKEKNKKSEKKPISIKDLFIDTKKNDKVILGKGSSATVYLAISKTTKKEYAVKLSKNKIEERKIIEREIDVHRKLKHPNLIRIIFIILEYAKNGNLFRYLNNKQGKKLPIELIKKLFRQISQGVAYLHQKKLVHRDLKPENILLDEKLNAKVCDFGWSVKVKKNEARNTFCGTYEYMAPEIYETEDYNESVDIWGLGILLYEMIHGKSPFAGKSAFKIFRNIVENKIEFKEGINKEASDLIIKILKINPDHRPTIHQILNHPFLTDDSQDKKIYQETRVKNQYIQDEKKTIQKDDYKKLITDFANKKIKNLKKYKDRSLIVQSEKEDLTDSGHNTLNNSDFISQKFIQNNLKGKKKLGAYNQAVFKSKENNNVKQLFSSEKQIASKSFCNKKSQKKQDSTYFDYKNQKNLFLNFESFEVSKAETERHFKKRRKKDKSLRKDFFKNHNLAPVSDFSRDIMKNKKKFSSKNRMLKKFDFNSNFHYSSLTKNNLKSQDLFKNLFSTGLKKFNQFYKMMNKLLLLNLMTFHQDL